MIKKLLKILPILLLVGCSTPINDSTDSGNNNPGTQTGTETGGTETGGTETGGTETGGTETGGTETGGTETGGTETGTEEEQVTESKVKSISLNVSELIYDVNDFTDSKGNKKKHYDLTVDYESSETLTDEDKEVIWSSDNSDIFTINQYGGIILNSTGSAYAVCKSKLYDVEARCLVIVTEDKNNVKKEYQLVEDFSTLKNKDTIVFAAPEANVTASLDTQGSYLHTVSSSFSSDKKKITSLGENTCEFYVGEEENGFTLESQEGKYFAGFNLARVGFVANKGNIEWRFTIDEGDLYIETYNDVRGWLMFNSRLNDGEGGFTLYESSVQFDLYMPSVYRLTIVK